MQRRQFLMGLTTLAVNYPLLAQTSQPQRLRLMTHASFDLPKEALQAFEKEHHLQLEILKSGDAGEMLSKLILTRNKPIADVVYGLDNTLLAKAIEAHLLQPFAADDPLVKAIPPKMSWGAPLSNTWAIPVDYGYVCLNMDKAWFANKGLAPPKSLQDLATPPYQKLLVIENPATSSTGMAFLLATIAHLGEEAAFTWWGKMRSNGLKVVKGWTEAYYTEFTHNKGHYPLVVSYASSPAAEVFYSKTKLEASPTQNLFLTGTVFRQVEGVALLKGIHPQAMNAAQALVRFLTAPPQQRALQTSMWMYPVMPQIPLDTHLTRFATEPTQFETLDPQIIAKKGSEWVKRFTKIVLR